MAGFKQAIQWLKEGKRIRRSSTRNEFYKIFLSKEVGSKDFVYYEHQKGISPEVRHFQLADFEAIDWKIYDDSDEEFIRKFEAIIKLREEYEIEVPERITFIEWLKKKEQENNKNV